MIVLGKQIKQLRNNHKFTQTELAEQIGVTKSTIAAYENDSRQPSYEVLIKMANLFKVSTDYLLLDKTDISLDIKDLNTEQVGLLKAMIGYFRKENKYNL